jgi:hypothetical protein
LRDTSRVPDGNYPREPAFPCAPILKRDSKGLTFLRKGFNGRDSKSSSAMTQWDVIGYVASGLVLGAFSMKNMVQLRIVAICSNIAFIGYGVGLDLIPVVALHVVLLPMNGWRLWQVLPARHEAAASKFCKAYRGELLTVFGGLPMRFAAAIGFFAVITSVAGWLILTQAESSAAVPRLHSVDLNALNSVSVPTLAALW